MLGKIGCLIGRNESAAAIRLVDERGLSCYWEALLNIIDINFEVLI